MGRVLESVMMMRIGACVIVLKILHSPFLPHSSYRSYPPPLLLSTQLISSLPLLTHLAAAYDKSESHGSKKTQCQYQIN